MERGEPVASRGARLRMDLRGPAQVQVGGTGHPLRASPGPATAAVPGSASVLAAADAPLAPASTTGTAAIITIAARPTAVIMNPSPAPAPRHIAGKPRSPHIGKD